MPQPDRDAVAAYLFHLRHAEDDDYQQAVERRLSDRETTHWLTPEEFERRLNEKDGR